MWQRFFGAYGEHAVLVALTVGLSLMGVVAWGTLPGSLSPFAPRRLGLVIYFTVASLLLRATLL